MRQLIGVGALIGGLGIIVFGSCNLCRILNTFYGYVGPGSEANMLPNWFFVILIGVIIWAFLHLYHLLYY